LNARERTRDLVLRYGYNAASYQIVNDSIKKWFSDNAVVGYVDAGRWKVVAGPPVCDPTALPSILDQWEESAGPRVCYFGVGERFVARAGMLSRVAMGAQPSWNPQEWAAITQADASLRKQFNRSRNKGVTVGEWSAERAENSADLRQVLQSWLESRGLPPLHFLVEPETLGFLRDRRVFVATQQGRPIAFLVLCPVPLRNGWLTEQFPRLPSAPNGTVELLMDGAVRAIASEGADYVTMGLVPLAHVSSQADNPPWLRFVSGWVKAHGRRFYNFRGLESFKEKFHPQEWETIYAVVRGENFSPAALNAVATAFSQQPAWKTVALGLGRAIKTEARTLFGLR
jgi:phosphatidylglycerol lysyltransferase